MTKSSLSSKALVFLVILASVFSLTPLHYQFLKEKRDIYKDTQYWFKNQLIDHFNPLDKRTFEQRYWINANNYAPAKGNIILDLCGEGPCSGAGDRSSYINTVAAATRALVISLEHRYYGLSVPFGKDSITVENMKYLTVEQALEDTANFINWVNANNTAVKITPNAKWIVVGGSYAGALSAWFRLKYPHLVVGSWASSPVINAILEFDTFDYHVFLATNKSSPQCPATIQNLTAYLEWNLYQNGSQWAQTFKAKFNAQNLTNEEFLWYIADNIGMTVQYGSRLELCNTLLKYNNFNDLFNAFVEMMNTGPFPPKYYSHIFLNDNTWDPNTAFIKLWNYQVCTQVGWFQPPYHDSRYATRSQHVSMSFFKLFCEQSFQKPLWPDVDAFNNEFGGRDIDSSNTVLINASEDPWLWASNTNSTNPSVSSYTATCDWCGHCIDLSAPSTRDPASLTTVRAKILANITQWFASPNESPSKPERGFLSIEI